MGDAEPSGVVAAAPQRSLDELVQGSQQILPQPPKSKWTLVQPLFPPKMRPMQAGGPDFQSDRYLFMAVFTARLKSCTPQLP
jgi:hypothetical protein